MLDISVKDLAISCGILQTDEENVAQIASRRHETLRDLINAVTHRQEFSHLRDSLHQLRVTINPVVHGKAIDEHGAIRTLRETLGVIHQLYEARG